VLATGICMRSAKARTAASAPDSDDAVAGEDDGALGVADELGGFAELVDSALEHRGAGGRAGLAASKSKMAVACCASLVMSTSTGPGRPERAIWKASRMAARCLRRG
jgi:hypothetical protein